MIQYGSEQITQLRFMTFIPRIERRDDQWIDLELRMIVDQGTPIPDGLIDLTALVICTHSGVIAQIVPLDEGCDCEFQFTSDEKEQIQAYVESAEMQEQIANLSIGE